MMGVRLGFAPGPGGSGNPDHGQHPARCPAIALVVVDASPAREQKVDGLGAVHGAAPSQADQRVDCQRPGVAGASLHHIRVRIGSKVMESMHLDSGLGKDPGHRLDVT